MSFENLKTELNDGILTITINRESKLNALNIDTIVELGKAFDDAKHNDEVKGIILTGAGEKAFVAGADISEMSDFNDLKGKGLAANGHKIFNKIENMHKPVIAAVNGFALGGGCELAMACHMRVASTNAKFGQPEVKLGLIPGYGGTQRLTRLIGQGKAIELLLTGDMIKAEEAKELGLVNHVVVLGDLLHFCHKLLEKIAKVAAPLAVGMVIDCVNDYADKEKDGFQSEIDRFGKCFGTEDFKEGTSAFMEKREANFQGK